MTKRYAYWRSPSGPVVSRHPAKYAPVAVLQQVGEMAEPAGGDAISFSGFFFKVLETALDSAFVVLQPSGEELNEHDASRILRGAIADTIKDVGGKKALPEDKVRKAADLRASAFFRQPIEAYTLVASLSVGKLPFKTANIAGCTITRLLSRKRYPAPDTALRDVVIAEHLKSSRYSLVKVSVSGRSMHEAAGRAIIALDLLRAFWSFVSTPAWSISFGRRRKPIGVIHPGPVYTLHDRKRTPFSVYWYDKHVREDRELFQPDEDRWKNLEEQRRWCTRRLRSHLLRSDLEGLIVRYVEALDQPDFDVAFLKMWSILEQLTDSIGNYDETVKRAARNFKREEQHLVRGIVDCLRTRRNLYVHSARESEGPEQIVYLVKQIVEGHLVDLIRNSGGVSTVEDYARQLARTQDLAVLKKDHQELGAAIRLIERREAKTRRE